MTANLAQSPSRPPGFSHPEEGLRHSRLSGNQGLNPCRAGRFGRTPEWRSASPSFRPAPGRRTSTRASPCAVPEAWARGVCGAGQARGEGGRRGRDAAARLPQGRPMAPPRPPRLVPALRALLYWSLVYGYCGLCASVHLLKLLWSIGRAPAQTFRRAARANPPACLNDPSLGTHCYVRIKDSGLRFHYVAAGERGRPLMLLLHGFPEFWYSWRHQLREFKSEYRVVALDLRGYGESDAPTHQESYKLDCLIADIKDILDSLGYSKCVLIGHDWGGMIAWLIAICYPEMIMKLIVINFPHPSVFTDYILRHPAQLFRSSFYYFFQIPWFPEFMFSINDFKALKHLFTSQSTGIGRRGRRLTTDDLEAYIYVFSQPGALSGPMNHYRNIFNCLPLKHHMVTTPTLLLWGEEDAFMEAEMAEVTKVYVKNYFRLTILSEGSHWLQQDQPDIVNRLIWAFLREETRRQ